MTKSQQNIAVLIIALIMTGTLAAFFYYMQGGSNVRKDPKYHEVAAAVGPQFDMITRYLDNVEKAYADPATIPVREASEAAKRSSGPFRFHMASMGVYEGRMGYCLVAEHVTNKGRAYHSSIPVRDPTWDGRRSYYHYVTGKEPMPDVTGPCNEQVIRRRG